MTLGQAVPKLDALHLMDGIEGLRSLPKHSVDMLLTDPPYGTTRNFWDVPLLWQALADRGYPQSLLEDLFWNNLRRLI